MKMQVKVMSLITVCVLLSAALFAFGCTGTTGKNDGSGVTGEESLRDFGPTDPLSAFSAALDSKGLCRGMFESEMLDFVDSLTYNGKSLKECGLAPEAAFFDGEKVCGISAYGGKGVGYGCVMEEKEDGTFSVSNRFSVEVELEGLPLPNGVRFGQSIDSVISTLMGGDFRMSGDFLPDVKDGTLMTLARRKQTSLALTDLRRSSDPAEYSAPVILVYREDYERVKSDTVTVEGCREVRLSFSMPTVDCPEPLLCGLELKTGESWREPELTLRRFTWDGWGITAKAVDGGLAGNIIDALNGLKPTGEKAKKISDSALESFSAGDIPVERGTLWINDCGGIYRVDPDMSRICRVDDYLGGGEYLEMSDSLKKMLNEAWYYYPYDYYTGVFSGGEFSISHVYEAASAVKVEVTDIRLIGEDGRVTLKLTAGCDTEVFVSATSYQSDDNLGSTDSRTLTLKADRANTLTLDFSTCGWQSCWLRISADNTVLVITVKE